MNFILIDSKLYDLYKNYTKLIKNSNPIYMEKYLMMN